LQENDKPVLVYTTCPSVTVAENIGSNLVQQRLCACVNILPGMISIYRWQGAVEKAEETAIIIKTRAGKTETVFAAVKASNPSDLPALVVLPIEGGSADYLDYIVSSTRSVKRQASNLRVGSGTYIRPKGCVNRFCTVRAR
jgi:periplasmic divalent cation tolerance protein